MDDVGLGKNSLSTSMILWEMRLIVLKPPRSATAPLSRKQKMDANTASVFLFSPIGLVAFFFCIGNCRNDVALRFAALPFYKLFFESHHCMHRIFEAAFGSTFALFLAFWQTTCRNGQYACKYLQLRI